MLSPSSLRTGPALLATRCALRLDRRLQPPFRRSLLCLALVGLPALAQDATTTRQLTVVPSFSASTEYSQQSGGSSGGSGELILRVGPGLQLSKRSGSVQGSLSYALSGILYSRRPDLNTIEHSLSANARAEAVPGWMYADASATVSKQSVDVLGLQSAPGSLRSNGNQRQVLNLQVSPYVRGELRGLADYEVRFRGGLNEVQGTRVGDYNSLGTSVSLSSPRQGTKLGWGLQGTADRVDYKAGRSTDNIRGTASLLYNPDPDLQLVARVGQESTNVGGLDRRNYDNYGAGLRWTPSLRTLISLDADKRYFGDSHQVTVEHRFKRSAVRFTSSRGVSTGGERPTTLFQLYMLQYTSIEPDPVQRFLRVVELLRQQGRDPNEIVSGGLITSALSLQQRQDLSYTYTGQRTTLTLQVFESQLLLLDNFNPALVGGSSTKQTGLLSSASHRLTPRLNLLATASWQRNTDLVRQGSSQLTSLDLGLTQALARNATAAVGARVSQLSGPGYDTREFAVRTSINVRF